MKKSVFSFFLCLMLLASNVYAEVGQLKIGISTGYPPFYYFTADNQPTCICIDIIDEVTSRMGIAVEYIRFPWKRMLQYGKSGEVDAVMPLFQTTEREQFLLFPAEALVIEENRFFTAAASPSDYTGKLEEILDHSVGVIDGYSYGQKFDSLTLKEKTVVMTQDQLIQLVLHQRVDYGIGNSKVIGFSAKQMGKAEELRFLSPPVTAEPLFIGFSKKRMEPNFVARFSEALREFKASVAYAEILQKYRL